MVPPHSSTVVIGCWGNCDRQESAWIGSFLWLTRGLCLLYRTFDNQPQQRQLNWTIFWLEQAGNTKDVEKNDARVKLQLLFFFTKYHWMDLKPVWLAFWSAAAKQRNNFLRSDAPHAGFMYPRRCSLLCVSSRSPPTSCQFPRNYR